MNPQELQLAKAAAEGTAAGLTESLHRIVLHLLEPAAMEIGVELGDRVRGWRLRNAVRVGRQAISMIETNAAPRRYVPVKVLLSALEQASLEDDVALQSRWAALLASAADASKQEITRAYVEILKELTPLDATILEWVRDRVPDPDRNDPSVAQDEQPVDSVSVRPRAEKASVIDQFGLTESTFELMASRLERLGLCDVGRYVFPTRAGFSGTGPRQYDSIKLRPLGVAFVDACRSAGYPTKPTPDSINTTS